MTEKDRIARALDLAVLKPTATRQDVIDAAELVEKHGLASICVAPCNIAVARKITKRVCAVIGFPHGNSLVEAKNVEAVRAIDYGAAELDVVMNYGRFIEGHWTTTGSELRPLIDKAHSCGVPVKVILETCYLTPEQITKACEICVSCKADWVKTSTGYADGGATPGVVQLMLDAVQGKAQVKASGGIKTYHDAKTYLDLGCTRIGSSKFHELLL
jgi:deoxyribose-phosphate aldolase